MNKEDSAEEMGEAGTNYRGPAILNGTRGPNMLLFLFFSRFILAGVSQKCSFTGVRNRSQWP